MKQHIILLMVLACLPLAVRAKDFGTWGDIWPVQEQSFLSLIHDRLQTMQDSGQLAGLQQQFQQRVEAHTLRPAPVEGLQTDAEAHVSWYDPTFVAGQDVADTQGDRFIRQGQRVNPLDTLTLNTTLYFIDGDDARQIAWMKAQKPPTLTYRVILVNGNIHDAADTLSERIYFDQQGALSRKLGLTYIPAVVMQDGRRLKVTSAAIKEGRE